MTSDHVDAEPGRVRWKTWATLLLVLVLLSPVVRGGDGVPLSTYPMYAVPRADVLEFVVPVAVTVDGDTQSLSTRVLAGTNDPLVAESFLQDEVDAGRAESLCSEIAARVDDVAVVRVEVRVERHHVVDRARGRESLAQSTTIASCPA